MSEPMENEVQVNDDLLVACGDIARERFRVLLGGVFKQADAALLALLDESKGEAAQSLYSSGLQELRSQRDPFVNACIRNFSDSYHSRCDEIKRGILPSVTTILSESSEAVVLEDDELEERILISELILEAESSLDLILNQLALHFGSLLESKALQGYQLPLAPCVIYEAFHAPFHIFNLPIKIRNILFDLLEQQAKRALDTLYDAVNRLLQQRDVLIDEASGSDLAKAPSSDEPPLITKKIAPNSESSFDQLCQLLEREQLTSVSAPENNVYTLRTLESYSTEKVLTVLSELQPRELQGVSLSKAVREALHHSLGSEFVNAISEKDQNKIDLVDLIFDQIGEDEGLSIPFRATVLRLQVPVLKVALQDECFFNDEEHVVHVVLREITQAGLVGGKGVEAAAAFLANQVVEHFGSDIALFHRVLTQFQKFVSGDEKLSLQDQKNLLSDEGQLQQRRGAASIVDELILAFMPCEGVPDFIGHFIDEIWREVLVETYLEVGIDSQAWRMQQQITEELLWSLKPKVTEAEQEYLQQMIPHLIMMLGDCLKSTEWGSANIDALLSELGAYHGSDLTSDNIEAEQPQILADKGCDDGFSVMVAAKVESNVGDSYETRIAELEIGQWMEFHDEKDELIRGKLVWRSSANGRMVFVNWQNRVVQRCSEKELAKMIQHWDARILNSAPAMERALSSITGIFRGKKYAD